MFRIPGRCLRLKQARTLRHVGLARVIAKLALLIRIKGKAMQNVNLEEKQFAQLRQQMLEEIIGETYCVQHLIGKACLDARVLDVIGRVPRHVFVPADLRDHAYLNRPLPIGYDKTISQPFIVALMTDLLQIRKNDTILEIGTGLGYQTAVLSRLARQVYSIERIEGLASQARQRLDSLGYDNIEIRIGDGHLGWPEHAPYDKVIVTAAPHVTPPALVEQLRNGGRMVLPAGQIYSQQLLLITKDADGNTAMQEILPVLFSAMEPGELRLDCEGATRHGY